MLETTQSEASAQTSIYKPTLNILNTIDEKVSLIIYLIDSAVESPFTFVDIDVELFSDLIEHAEAQPRSVRLVMAMSLLSEVLLMVGHQQSFSQPKLP